ncbi:MAG: hypothetical protein NT121_21130 [Chloroflexi bacterium]|nr:hypothetical protein [Chloroflexota bacterium]
MTLMDAVRKQIRARNLPPIFKSSDLKGVGIDDPNNNLSNYDKKNFGALNTKVLVSSEINGETYYTFDEQLFE